MNYSTVATTMTTVILKSHYV